MLPWEDQLEDQPALPDRELVQVLPKLEDREAMPVLRDKEPELALHRLAMGHPRLLDRVKELVQARLQEITQLLQAKEQELAALQPKGQACQSGTNARWERI